MTPEQDKTRHTPTPWEQSGSEIMYWPENDTDFSKLVAVCQIDDVEQGPKEEEQIQISLANAAFIVTACNSHTALVEALKSNLRTVEIMRRRYVDSDSDMCLARMESEINAALAAVGEG